MIIPQPHSIVGLSKREAACIRYIVSVNMVRFCLKLEYKIDPHPFKHCLVSESRTIEQSDFTTCMHKITTSKSDK